MWKHTRTTLALILGLLLVVASCTTEQAEDESRGGRLPLHKNSSITTRHRWFSLTVKPGPSGPSWSISRPDATF